jgi:hypothetical protein
VTIVILLVLVAVLWLVVLVPSAVRHRAEKRGAGSIDHFHHQLQLLEHAGPKIVEPAYRLHTAMPGADYAPDPDNSEHRPKLFLLGSGGGDEFRSNDPADYQHVGYAAPAMAMADLAQTRLELAAHRREQARRRCNLLLAGLAGTTIITGGIGVIPAARLAWIFTGIFGLATLGIVALIGYARELEAQRRPRRPVLPRSYDQGWEVDQAEAGYPGAWDDDFVVLPQPIAVAR